MNKDEIFLIWAPAESPWSCWAKPVLFAHLDLKWTGELSAATEVMTDVSWAPPVQEKVALVLDLPGAEGIFTGLALAERGYRPVPLYNALPLPPDQPVVDPVTGKETAAVDVVSVVHALKQTAGKLSELSLSSSAPPAFLLDANRGGRGRIVFEGEFDNRSICFTTDFPSANFLSAHGIRRVLMVRRTRTLPQWDLAHCLCRWQDGGLVLEQLLLGGPGQPEPLTLVRPGWYGAMFQRALAALGFRRAPGGGFGAWMPESYAGG